MSATNTSLRSRAIEATTGLTPESDTASLVRFSGIYLDVYGVEPCITCTEKLRKAIQKLNKWAATTNTIRMENTFKLKPNVLITRHGLVQDYTNANLTDEVAIELLAKGLVREDVFAEMPENWEELVNSYSPESEDNGGLLDTFEKEDLERLTNAQLQEMLEAQGVEFPAKAKKAELIDLILDSTQEEE